VDTDVGIDRGAAVFSIVGVAELSGEVVVGTGDDSFAPGVWTDGCRWPAGRCEGACGGTAPWRELVCAGVGVGAERAVGVAVAVGMTRGAMTTGPSRSTGPSTCVVGVGVGWGGSWKSRTDWALAALGAAITAINGNIENRRIGNSFERRFRPLQVGRAE
jgi:hypothetical protein